MLVICNFLEKNPSFSFVAQRKILRSFISTRTELCFVYKSSKQNFMFCNGFTVWP